jgi:hypothetical protein
VGQHRRYTARKKKGLSTVWLMQNNTRRVPEATEHTVPDSNVLTRFPCLHVIQPALPSLFSSTCRSYGEFICFQLLSPRQRGLQIDLSLQLQVPAGSLGKLIWFDAGPPQTLELRVLLPFFLMLLYIYIYLGSTACTICTYAELLSIASTTYKSVQPARTS